MQQLTSFDAQILALEDGRNHAHVSLLVVFDAALAVAAVRERIAERLPEVAPLRWQLAEVPLGLDYPYWVDRPDVDLDFHVRELALPAPGDEEQLTAQVARLVSRPLDRTRPLWELYVIHGLERERSALLLKIHHAAVDGVSVGDALALLLDGAAPTNAAAPAGPVPTRLELLGRGLAALPRQPLRALRALPALRHVAAIPHVRVGRGRVPSTALNGAISPHRRLALAQVPLADVRRVKDHFGVTVNDVVVAACAGALRRWLADVGEPVDEALTTMIPVSVRTPEQEGTFGNRVSAMLVDIPTDEADPAARLRSAHERLAAAKQRHAALPAEAILEANQLVPPALLGLVSRAGSRRARGDAPVNTVISNVPGSPIAQSLAGVGIEAIYPVSAVMDGVGLNLTLWSYCGTLHFGVVVDRDTVADPRPLADALVAAHAELAELAA